MTAEAFEIVVCNLFLIPDQNKNAERIASWIVPMFCVYRSSTNLFGAPRGLP